MPKVNISKDIIASHTDEEILSYMISLAAKIKVAYNYSEQDCLLVSLMSEYRNVEILLDLLKEYKARIFPDNIVNV